jgi:hypothetical protein
MIDRTCEDDAVKQTIELNGKIFDGAPIIVDRFGLNVNTIQKWIERGLLPEPVKIGGRNFFQRDRVDELMLKGE